MNSDRNHMLIRNRSIDSKAFRKITAPLLCIALLAAAALIPAHASDKAPAVDVKVGSQQSGPTISRQLFGQFAEHLGRGIYEGLWVGPDSKIPNTRGIRNDVVVALKELHVPNVRWPGGCFA